MFCSDDLVKIKKLKPFFKKNILPDLVTWNEIERVLNFRPFVNNNRFHILSNKKYNWPSGGWLTDNNTYPADIILSEMSKYVCYIQDCSRINKKINDVCQQLENTLNIPTDAHIFFSLNKINLKGFGKHNDAQHNLIVCVDGSFIIKVYGDDYTLEEKMNNGDAVFVPKGVDHEVIPLTKRLSVSFPMNPKHKILQDRSWLCI